uniref:UBP-type domain-containing protein n=1 Tax=Anopheles atroparvus TaxID=41427 RepID=A0AAG5DN00_ANOAO
MATNENCNHNQKVNFPAVRNRIEKSGFDKFCGMCALDPNAQKGSAGVLWLCLSCGSQLCDQDMKLHALLHHGVPRADVHALAMNTDTFDVRCYCCNVPVEPCVDTPLLEIVEYCLGKAFETRGSIKPPVRSSFRMRGICANPYSYINPELQCWARTPFLLTMMKERVTSKSSVDIPGGAVKFFDGQEIQLPTIENFPLRSSSLFEILYDVMNELISDDNCYVSGARLKDYFKSNFYCDYYKVVTYFIHVDDSDRSELEQLIARTFYGTRPSEEQLRKRKCITEFYREQLHYSSTAYCHTKVFRGTFVTKRYCSRHTRAEIKHISYW